MVVVPLGKFTAVLYNVVKLFSVVRAVVCHYSNAAILKENYDVFWTPSNLSLFFMALFVIPMAKTLKLVLVKFSTAIAGNTRWWNCKLDVTTL